MALPVDSSKQVLEGMEVAVAAGDDDCRLCGRGRYHHCGMLVFQTHTSMYEYHVACLS